MPKTGMTLSGDLPLVVDSIRGGSYKFLVQTGVMKALVTPVGMNENGDSFEEAFWDPTDISVEQLEEGVDFTNKQAYVNSHAEYFSEEWGTYTYITDNVKEDARESVIDEHSRAHGIAHAKYLERNLVSNFDDFTAGTIDASTGLDLPFIGRGKAQLQGVELDPGDALYFVNHPWAWNYLVENMSNNSNYGVRGDLGNRVQEKYWQATLLGDVTCYYSNYIEYVEGSTTLKLAGMFTKSAIGLFMPRDYRLEDQRFITERAVKLVSTMRYGSATRIPGFGVKYNTLAEAPADIDESGTESGSA